MGNDRNFEQNKNKLCDIFKTQYVGYLPMLPACESESESHSVVSTLCDPMDYTVCGIPQARILEWVAFPFPRGSSQPRDRTRSPVLQTDSLPAEPPGKPKNTGVGHLSHLHGIFLT